MASRNNCLVCCDPVKKVSRRKENSDLLEEELCVYFFVKKFILRDIVEGRIFSNSAEGLVGDDEVDFEKYLKSGKPLGECVAFCSSCQDSVKQAKETYANLCQLLVQLSKLQSSLQQKLRSSFHEEKETRRTDRSLRSTIRRKLKEELVFAEDVEVNLESLKVEVQQETLYPMIVKTEPNEDDLIDEEFGLENDDCNLDLKEFVISPAGLTLSEEKEDLEISVESKAAAPKGKRGKQRKRKRAKFTRQRKKSTEPRKNGVTLQCRTCPVCGAVFYKRSKMKYHLNAVHEKQTVFKCNIEGCGKEYYLKDSYTTHIRRHLSQEQIMHLILADKFNLVKLTEGTPFNLDDTMNAIDQLESREPSQDIVDQVLNRTCPECRKIFDSPAKMQHHLKTHQNVPSDSRFVCEKCGKSYSLLSSYKTHVRYDHVEIAIPPPNENRTADCTSVKPKLPFVCDIEGCNRSFLRPEYVRSHKRNFHHLGKDAGPRLCAFCGKELLSSYSLKRHILTHHTENAPRRFKCRICDKTFLTSTLLKKHLMCKSHGGKGRPWVRSKWDPKYNLSRKKKTQTSVSLSSETPLNCSSGKIVDVNPTCTGQLNNFDPNSFQNQDDVIAKGFDCPSEDYQPPPPMFM